MDMYQKRKMRQENNNKKEVNNKDNLADANVQYVQSKIKKSEFEKILF